MDRIKYPRTLHAPFSPGVQSDDKVIQSTGQFYGHRVILTEKMDGENTSMYNHGIHARSVDSAHHPSRDMVKRIWGEICWFIPDDYRICGENMYARHSIEYNDLDSYFYIFSLWKKNTCLSWDDTAKYAQAIGLPTVRVLYDGQYDKNLIREICEGLDHSKVEGAVLRIADEFDYSDFNKFVMKYVRAGHVQTDKHWMTQKIVPNELTKK